MRPGHIVVVEDDTALALAITRILARRGHEVEAAGSAAEVRRYVDRRVPELILLDLHLPDESGMDLIPELKASDEPVSIMVITGDKNVNTVVEAMKVGADHFLPKPFDLERLVEEVERSLSEHRVKRRASVYQARVGKARKGEVLPDLVGSSPPIKAVRELAGRVADTDSSVLLLGESGTGKGMVARGIHRMSQRASASFVEINCASIQAQLLESEIFGHEKGAFTGAATRKPGLMEIADGGSLFLDEIAEMEMQSQGKLLTALENRSFRRVGGVKEISVDVRLIAATNHDLEKEVAAGTFRTDLFYRLNVFQIEVPPLRERLGDLPELVRHFVRTLNPHVGRQIETVSPEVLDLMAGYRWPGNVRELRNVVERAMILAQGDELRPEHLPSNLRSTSAPASGPLASLEEVEKAHIQRVIDGVEQNIQRAAKVLGISRSTLYAKIEKYELRTEPGGSSG
jgi:DNA-binding NtrC family response regulator